MQSELRALFLDLAEKARVALQLSCKVCPLADRIGDHRIHLVLLLGKLFHRNLGQTENTGEVSQLFVRKLSDVFGLDVRYAQLVLLVSQSPEPDPFLDL